MEDVTQRLDELGQAVRQVSDQMTEADPSVARARERLFTTSLPARHLPAQWWVAAALIACCGLGVWMGAGSLFRRQPVAFDVGTPPRRGIVGEWLAADEHELDVRFSEGTALSMFAGTRVRVTEASIEGAEIVIEHGGLLARVVHRGTETRWAVRAGPFRVRVTGTSFETGWEPATETFSLTVREGSVEVTGPSTQQRV